MQEDDICEATKHVLDCKVAVKSSKVKTVGVQTLENWCALHKIDRAIMNKIMHIVRDWSLPSRGPEYSPYTTSNWDQVALQYGITNTSISNLRVELYKDPKNEFFTTRLRPTNPSRDELQREIKNMICKLLKHQDGGANSSKEVKYVCILAPSIDSLDLQLEAPLKPFGSVVYEYLLVLFLFNEVGKLRGFADEDIQKVLQLCMYEADDNLMEPTWPIIWITSLEDRDRICDAIKKDNCSIVTWFYISQAEDNFAINVGEASSIVCISFIVPHGITQANESFSKFTGFVKRIGPALHPGKP